MPTRGVSRIALLALSPALAALAVEGAARLLPASAPTDSESSLLWVAGARPPFVCVGGACRTDPGLVVLSDPDEAFSAVPGAGVFRVACVGGSTTAGWPYQPRGGYPEWLGATLQAVLPGRKAEVLNLGIDAWDGARLETVFDQALSFRPDVVVVRIGYNDYQDFLLRHPRGGVVDRAALRARLCLLGRSAAFRLLSRGLGPAPRRGIVAEPSARLTDEEEDALIAEHRARLRRFLARARAAGASLVVLGLPHDAALAPGYFGARALDRQQAATAEEARSLGALYVPLTRLKGRERYVDWIHSDLEGYRLTALDVARALAAAGLGAPAARWRWDRLPPPEAIERRLGLDDPDYRAHLEVRLARFSLVLRRSALAARHMEFALLAAPNPDLVPEEEAGDGAEMRALYRKTYARLADAGRVAPPHKAKNRRLAGI